MASTHMKLNRPMRLTTQSQHGMIKVNVNGDKYLDRQNLNIYNGQLQPNIYINYIIIQKQVFHMTIKPTF